MKSYAAIAALIAAAQADVFLTNEDFNIEAGAPFDITWAGAQGAVTVELLHGKFDDLKPLAVITSDASDGKFTWTVPEDLPAKGPYAFSITDGVSPINYSVQFPIHGVTVDGKDTEDTETDKPSTTAAPTTTAASSTKTTVSAQTAKETTTSFEIESTSSVPTASTAEPNSSTLSTTTTAPTTKTSTAPSTVASPPDGESKAPGMASPLALILVSVAAMFYFQ